MAHTVQYYRPSIRIRHSKHFGRLSVITSSERMVGERPVQPNTLSASNVLSCLDYDCYKNSLGLIFADYVIRRQWLLVADRTVQVL